MLHVGRCRARVLVFGGFEKVAIVRRWMGLVTRGWERKRFYEQATVHEAEGGGYQVKLDHRNLRTPLRRLFVVPTHPLALAVAQEWNEQETYVQPALMHLTGLCNTVIDDPNRRERERDMDSLIQFLTADTLSHQIYLLLDTSFRAAEPEELVERQSQEWDPILEWFNNSYSVSIQPITGLIPPTVNPQTLSQLRQYMSDMDVWRYTGFEHSTESCKSLVLACALFEGRVDVDTACDLARLEVIYQTAKWGVVEWQHSVEEQDLRSRLAASLLIARLANPYRHA